MLKILKFPNHLFTRKDLCCGFHTMVGVVLGNIVHTTIYFPGVLKERLLLKLAFLRKVELSSHL